LAQQNTALTSQVSSLSQQNTTLTRQNAALTGGITADVDAVQQNLRVAPREADVGDPRRDAARAAAHARDAILNLKTGATKDLGDNLR
jgi:hypothetical protein